MNVPCKDTEEDIQFNGNLYIRIGYMWVFAAVRK
jgi:hypothetical protein